MPTAQKQFKNIDEYIKSSPKDTQGILEKIKGIVQKHCPEALETISYGIPTYDLNGKHLVHFAGFKTHIGFYPTPSGIEAFKKEISKFTWAKGSVQFPVDKPVPFDLIEKIIVFRIKELEKKS